MDMLNRYSIIKSMKTNAMSRRKLLGSLGLAAGASFVGSTPAAGQEAGKSATKNPFSLEGKSAVVTGAARGIGRAIAIALAESGADVMGIDICAPASPVVPLVPATEDELNETGRLVQSYKRKFIGIKADIRDLGAMRQAADRANKEFGKIDILVANAAVQVYSPLAEMNDAQWKDVIDVNLNGTANTIRAIVNGMIAQKSGRIIIISSGQGKHGFKNASSYSASKWAVIGLMKSLALELAEYNITVNTVEPGLVDTAMTRNPGRWNLALKEAGKPAEENPKEEDVIAARMIVAVQKIPWMQPADVAPAVVFLASDAAYRVTGASYDATAGDSAKYTA
jgi:NAD(P)-dependent dehydrogenase (short-subunit alcohol dehydrogenase family)